METLLNSALWLLVFSLIYASVLSKFSFFQTNRWFLLTGIVAAFVLPFLHFNVVIEQTLEVYTTQPDMVFSSVQEEAERTINWMQILLVVYGVGVLVVMIKLSVSLWSLYRQYRRADIEQYEGLQVTKTNQPVSAYSFFNWVVINAGVDPNEQQILLNHESVHARQKHSIDMILAELLTAIHWFNPIAYWYKKQVVQNLEFIADYKTQHLQPDKSLYAKILVKSVTYPKNYALVNNFNSSLIKKRITMLHRKPTSPQKKWLYLLIIPVLSLVFFAFNRQEVVNYIPSDNQILNDTIDPKGLKVELIINKHTTDQTLKLNQKLMASQNVDFKYSNLKRNDKGEITSLSLNLFNEELGSTSFNINNSKAPINPLSIYVDFINKKLGVVPVEPIDKKVNFINLSTPDELTLERVDEQSYRLNDSIFIYDVKLTEKDLSHWGDINNITVVKGDDGKKVYKVNGKTLTKEEVDELSMSKVSFKMNNVSFVLKGKKNSTNGTFKNDDDSKTVTIIEKEGQIIYKYDGKELTKEALNQIDPSMIKDIKIIKSCKDSISTYTNDKK